MTLDIRHTQAPAISIISHYQYMTLYTNTHCTPHPKFLIEATLSYPFTRYPAKACQQIVYAVLYSLSGHYRMAVTNYQLYIRTCKSAK